MQITKTATGYVITGRIVLDDLRTLDIPNNASLDLGEVKSIDQLSVIFLRNSGWKVIPPKTTQANKVWQEVNTKLDNYSRFINQQTTAPSSAATLSMREFLRNMLAACHRPTRLASEVTWAQLYQIGWRTVPTMIVVSICAGFAIPAQVLAQLPVSIEHVMPSVFSYIMIDQVAPLIGSNIISARCVSTITANIASARAHEEWDALIVANHNPYHCWCWPHIVTCTTITVLLIIMFAFVGSLAGALLLSYRLLNRSLLEILVIMRTALSQDMGSLLLIVKSILFGLSISCTSVYYGCTSDVSDGISTSINKAMRTSSLGIIGIHLFICLLSALIN